MIQYEITLVIEWQQYFGEEGSNLHLNIDIVILQTNPLHNEDEPRNTNSHKKGNIEVQCSMKLANWWDMKAQV